MIDAVIDLSHHNTITDLAKAKASGVQGIFLKATQGTSYVDPTFAERVVKIRQIGILAGAYHFGTGGSPEAQAEKFLSVVGTDTVMALDLETNPSGPSMSIQEAEIFVQRVFDRTGKYPGLYTGIGISDDLAKAGITDASKTVLTRCWLWLAKYGPRPAVPKFWSDFKLWQYTDGTHGQAPLPPPVSGIGACDRDWFNGTAEELVAFWNANKR